MAARYLGRLSACVVALCLLSGHSAMPAPAGGWQVVLAAGDDAEPVFDNATRAFERRLRAAGVPPGNIHRLSASGAEIGGEVEPADADTLLRRVADLPARPGDRCLVFLTSHGERGAGLWLARSDRALRPDELARALSGGCAGVPTVVIVSACYSGGFAAGKMAQPNRIILTASRRERPSFGCQVQRTYNFFDQCLLGTLPKAGSWRAVFSGVKACVGRMERALRARPSDPQSYFGRAAVNLDLGF